MAKIQIFWFFFIFYYTQWRICLLFIAWTVIMIAFLSGEILFIDETSLILQTQSWVGYECVINARQYSYLFQLQHANLYIYHQISENNQSLFWFLDIEERHMFQELIKVSWVGWKWAQNILTLPLDTLKQAIASEDIVTLTTIKWVGKKMAEKLILELKEKDIITSTHLPENKQMTQSHLPSDLYQQLSATLLPLWYTKLQIEEALSTLPSGYTRLDDILPYVIKKM